MTKPPVACDPIIQSNLILISCDNYLHMCHTIRSESFIYVGTHWTLAFYTPHTFRRKTVGRWLRVPVFKHIIVCIVRTSFITSTGNSCFKWDVITAKIIVMFTRKYTREWKWNKEKMQIYASVSQPSFLYSNDIKNKIFIYFIFTIITSLFIYFKKYIF